MAFQGKFTCYSVGPGEGSMKGPREDSAKGPVEGSTKGASQDFLLSTSLIEGLSRRLIIESPFLR